MKKFKSLSFVMAAVLLLSGAGPLPSAFAECSATALQTKVMVAVSTTPASPTQLLAATNTSCGEVYLMLHWSGTGTYPNSEFLLLSDSSSGFSTSATTGTVRIPAGQRPSDFLSLGLYRGPLYAVVIGTTSAMNVSVIRKP